MVPNFGSCDGSPETRVRRFRPLYILWAGPDWIDTSVSWEMPFVFTFETLSPLYSSRLDYYLGWYSAKNQTLSTTPAIPHTHGSRGSRGKIVE
jgi:hypothetical protein